MTTDATGATDATDATDATGVTGVTDATGAKSEQRFPGLWDWLPDKTWLYAIIFGFVLIIWLFFPLVFILGLVILVLWFTA